VKNAGRLFLLVVVHFEFPLLHRLSETLALHVARILFRVFLSICALSGYLC
jgi:hypothetical protein